MFPPTSLVFYLFSHHSIEECPSHCISVPFPFQKKLYVCSRCTGVLLGTLFIIFLHYYLAFPFSDFIKFILAVSLGVTAASDWFLYKLKILSTTVGRRFLTGVMTGMGIFLAGMIHQPIFQYISFSIIFVILLLVFLLSVKKNRKSVEETKVRSRKEE